ncbi:MAG: hypothetical protein WBV77_13485 [Solirubrobacteraceae bacterium]
MREIRLYDSLSGELVPVNAGDAIRVEVRTSPVGVDGGVDVASTRPLVLFSFLERFLQREGFATKFLFDSPGGDMLYELSEPELLSADSPDSQAELDAEHDVDLGDGLDAEHEADQDGELDAEGDVDTGGGLDADQEGERDADQEGERDADQDGEREADQEGELDAESDGEDIYDSGLDAGMCLHEVPRSDVDQWVNICFGASRDGVEIEPACAGERVLLSDALKHFGHPAVALYLLGTHYSMPLGDALTGLATGSKNALRIREALEKLLPDQPSPPDMRHYVEAFRDALADDLDTPLAFVAMFEWLLEAERRGGEVGDHDLRVMLEVLELDGLAAPAGAP